MNLDLGKSAALTLAALAALPAPEPTPQAAELQPVLYYWEGSPLEGVEGDAWALVTQMENHFRANYFESSPVRVFTEAFEPERTAHWFVPHESVAQIATVRPLLEEDEGWGALVQRQAQLFDVGTSTLLFHLGGLPPKKAPKAFRWLQVTHSPLTKMPLAERHARRVVEHLEAGYSEIDAHAYTSDLADRTAIYWMVDFDSVVEWSAFRLELQRDDEYIELFEAADGLFIEERTTDTMIRD